MSSNPDFDRWYAATHVKFIVRPSHNLETFGNTLVNYTLISELEDYPGKIRIREGRLEAHQPQIITPKSIIETIGFSDENGNYTDFRTFEKIRIRKGTQIETTCVTVIVSRATSSTSMW